MITTTTSKSSMMVGAKRRYEEALEKFEQSRKRPSLEAPKKMPTNPEAKLLEAYFIDGEVFWKHSGVNSKREKIEYEVKPPVGPCGCGGTNSFYLDGVVWTCVFCGKF